jgi:phosphoribosylaminoimidazole-succinocarboxamide synthase
VPESPPYAASIQIDLDRPPLLETDLAGLPLHKRGKVRDVYDLGDRLLVVATDRLSAFDVVLPTGIPGKGVILTQMSLFWFRLLEGVVANHVLTAEVQEYGSGLERFRDQLEGRSMVVRKTDVLPVECVVRGYLAGSGFKDYMKTGAVCGIPLPAGLGESERLDPPLFTPATKAETGHDENIPFETMEATVGRGPAVEARRVSLEIYARARAHAEARGIILADTKFEFGERGGRLVWIDEALTPDSSRFWPLDAYAPGGPQPSFDKQYVRDYLETLGWDKRPPAPALPAEVVRRTVEKYIEAWERLRTEAPSAPSPRDGRLPEGRLA